MNRTEFSHGLVVGKFYPPHLGHEYLIRTALSHCQRVTVAVLGSSVESIPLATRVSWLCQSLSGEPRLRVSGELDDAPIDYGDPAVWDLHVESMRRALARADVDHAERAPPVDAIFSSEAYGAELARRFDAAHVCLDASRALYPISGSAIRADPCANWHLLSNTVRAGMCARVVLLGAESSGTTTLTRDLCNALQGRGAVWSTTRWVPEYGREYSANLLAIARARRPSSAAADLVWDEADFVHIAEEQTRREQSAAGEGGPILLCDTDAFATCIWHERYRGAESQRVLSLCESLPRRALYLLTDHAGVSFEDDGLRDGEHLRPWMTRRFERALMSGSTPWQVIRGTRAERLESALRAVDAASAQAFHFAAPLVPRTRDA